MAELKEWINKLKERDFILGECNCSSCIAPKNVRATVVDALLDLTTLTFIPREYDPDLNFLYRNSYARNYEHYSSGQWVWILKKLVEIADRHRLRDVKQKKYRHCSDCGNTYRKGKGRIVKAGVHVCPHCWEHKYILCKVCGKIKYSRSSTLYSPNFDFENFHSDGRYDTERMCYSCYVQHFEPCAECGMPVDMDHWVDISQFGREREPKRVLLTTTPDGDAIDAILRNDPNVATRILYKPWKVLCEHCAERVIISCPRCGIKFYKRDGATMMYHGERQFLCRTCLEAMQVIKRYDYAVPPKFLTAKRERRKVDTLHYGVELEMECPEARRNKDILQEKGREILDWWGNDEMYIKHDGSLDCGFEVVSHPFTWAHYLANKNKWVDFLEYIKERGFTADYFSDNRGVETCGFHTHLSKDAFTSMHLYKFINFFYKQSTRPFILGIAGRSKSAFARFETSDLKHAKEMSKEKKNISGQRYSAINLMGGHAHQHGNAPKECKTAEIRIFKGSLEPFIFHKNLEFLQSTFEFSSFNSPKDMQVRKYIDYLLLKPVNWRCLISYIKNCYSINKAYSYVAQMMKGV